MIAAAEQDYRLAASDVTALIAGARKAGPQHRSELELFIHVYATLRFEHPTRVAAIASCAIMRLAEHPHPPEEP
jgi:hypothetical protein